MPRTAKKPDRDAVFRRRNTTAAPTAGGSPLPDLDAAVAVAAHSLGQMIPVDRIREMPDQPRKMFNDDAIHALADSIRERGVLQPIRVKALEDGWWQLIAGERRLRAAKLAQLDTIPAFVCAPGDATDEFADALAENLLREDLNNIEIAEGLQTLIDDWGVSQNEAAKRLGLSKTKASQLIAALRLPEEIQHNLAHGHLSMGHVTVLLPDGLTDEQRIELAREAMREGWPLRRFEQRVRVVRAENEGRAGEDDSDVGEENVAPRRQASAPIPPDRLEYAKRWADAASQATNLDLTVTAMRGPGYQIRVSTHEALIELGGKLGFEPVDL